MKDSSITHVKMKEKEEIKFYPLPTPLTMRIFKRIFAPTDWGLMKGISPKGNFFIELHQFTMHYGSKQLEKLC